MFGKPRVVLMTWVFLVYCEALLGEATKYQKTPFHAANMGDNRRGVKKAEGRHPHPGDEKPMTPSPPPALKPGVDKPSEDYSLNPDVVFMVQRSGMSDTDFSFVQKFMGLGLLKLEKVSPSKDDSRIGLTLFTAFTRHPITFTTCCNYGKSELQRIIKKVSLYGDLTLLNKENGDHSDLTPHTIDIPNAFRRVRETFLKPDLPKRKPTLIIFIANFQTPYASFRLLLDASDEIKACKNDGAWISTIIIDPLQNRQPRLNEEVALDGGKASSSGSRKKRDVHKLTTSQKHHKDLREFLQSEDGPDVIREKNYREKLKKIFRDSDESYVKSVVQVDPEREKRVRLYNGLVLAFAQALSSRPYDGFKLSKYAELVQPPVTDALERLLIRPTSWFGEAEVSTTCDDTKNMEHRAIWSPKYFSDGQYPDGTICQWKLQAKTGYRLLLRFNKFNTEEIFDEVMIYDGHQPDSHQQIGKYSGDLETRGELPTVNGTNEKMLVVFRTDGGNSAKGFYATWTPEPMPLRIGDAAVMYVVDVSASIFENDLSPVTGWIKAATKLFQFKEDFEQSESLPEESRGKPCKFGLLKFNNEEKILSSIEVVKTRMEFYLTLDQLEQSMKTTYIGQALDFTRLKQFYLLDGEEGYMPRMSEGRSDDGWVTGDKMADRAYPYRVLFLFSDAYSIDDPRPAAKRLCEAGIFLVLIGIGRVNIRGQEDLISYCGMAFGIDIPVPEVISKIKTKLRIKNFTTSPTIPELPSTPYPPTRTKSTTQPSPGGGGGGGGAGGGDGDGSGGAGGGGGGDGGIPPKTTIITITRTKIVIINKHFENLLPPRKFNYMGLAILLIVIACIECLILWALIYFNFGLPRNAFARPSDSKAMLAAEESSSEEETRTTFLPGVFPVNKTRKLPTVINSFFTRHRTTDSDLNLAHADPTPQSNRPCCSNSKANNLQPDTFSDNAML